MDNYTVPLEWQSRTIKISVVGAGGTGSFVIAGLARIDNAIKELGHEYGLSVTAWDPDRVERPNIGRQLFFEQDLGRNKARVLINNVNLAYGLGWDAMPDKYQGHGFEDIIISCVDTKRARRTIGRSLPQDAFIIDCGNERDFGQVIIGKLKDEALPSPYDEYPSLVAGGKEDNRASCSLMEALEGQELMINQFVATYCLQIIWEMLRYAKISKRGYFINLSKGTTRSLKLNGQD